MDKTLSPILDALQFESLSESEQEALLIEISDLVFQGSLVRLVERMDDATREEFEQLMENETDDEAMEAFLRERVPGADKAVEEAVQELTDDILAETGTNQE